MPPAVRWGARLGLVAVSAYAGLLAAQLAIPVVQGVIIRRPFDTDAVRSTVEIAREMRGRGVDAAVLVYPGIWLDETLEGGGELFPLAGISRRATVFCEERAGAPIVYASDRFGFRNAATPPAQVELAAIGDSFTQGACVRAEDGFVAQVGKRFRGTWNLGMSGDGPLLELATLEEYLPEERPRVVLWFFYPGNDLWDLGNEQRSAVLLRYLNEPYRQGLPARQAEIDRRLNAWLERAERRFDADQLTRLIDGETPALERTLHFFSLAPLRHREWRVGSLPSERFALLERVLARARRTVESWGGRLILVYLPDHVATPRLPVATRRDRAATLAAFRAAGVAVIDAAAATDHLARSRLFVNSTSHYSEEGNRLVAEATLRALPR